MKKILTFCAALALSASGAMAAGTVGQSAFVLNEKTGLILAELEVTPTTLPNNIGVQFVIDISGVTSNDAEFGANTVIVFDTMMPGEDMNGVGWDVIQSSADSNLLSWGSEMVMSFGDNVGGAAGLYLTPSGTGAPVSFEANSSGGILKLDDAGIPDIPMPDGNVRIEFFESYDDEPGVDGIYEAGSTITVQMTPEPASLALLALGGLTVIRRRR